MGYCKELHFGRNNPKASYILGEKFGQIKEIGHSNTERDLGAVYVKWKNPSKSCCKQGQQNARTPKKNIRK